MIVPSIDLMDGKAVQLERGCNKVLERDDVFALAERFGRTGLVAIVDLDAAMERGNNRALIKDLCRRVPAYVGGGVRTRECALEYLRAGAAGVVIGTAATESMLAELPRWATFLAVDARGGRVALRGWTELVEETPVERARRLGRHCAGMLYTAVDREGVFGGADFETARALRDCFDGKLIVAGGIATTKEIAALDRMGIDAQIGMALYTGALDLAEAIVAVLDFDRGDGLIPTVVCDAATRNVRMLAYSSPESLRYALREGVGAYFSRSRGRLWVKGETSGNTQKLVSIAPDCDRDALCFYVEQRGDTCHARRATCFSDDAMSWPALMQRVRNRAGAAANESYTARLLADPGLLREKLREEASELADAAHREDVAWEAADVLYFTTVRMQAAGVSVDDVMAQLRART